jgi:signal transduction histidine kinase
MSNGRSRAEAEGQDPVLRPERVSAVQRTRLLSSPRLPGLDRLAYLAVRVLGVPMAAVLIVDGEREVCLGCAGWPDRTAGSVPRPLEQSLAKEVASGEPLIVADARQKPRLARHPAFEALGIAAFAGFPLRSAEGEVLGVFCAADHAAREWTEAELGLLEELSAGAGEELRLHQALGEQAELLEALQRTLAAHQESMATVAHDLRSPLHGALLVLQIMEAQGATRETNGVLGRALRSMNEILGQRLSREVRARQEHLIAPVVVDPLELLLDLRALFAPRAAAEGIALTVERAERLPQVAADLPRVRQALSSLLAGAFRRTAPGGRIVLAARPAERDVRLEIWPSGRPEDGGAPDPAFGAARTIVHAHGGETGIEESGCAWLTLPAAPTDLESLRA